MSDLVKNYYKILETIELLNVDCGVKKVGRKSKVSDNQIVALSLMAEFMGIDSENLLFQMIPKNEIENIVERSQFNKRRRKLFSYTELIRTKLNHSFIEFEDYFIVDSMPLEICKMARHKMAKICKERFETAP